MTLARLNGSFPLDGGRAKRGFRAACGEPAKRSGPASPDAPSRGDGGESVAPERFVFADFTSSPALRHQEGGSPNLQRRALLLSGAALALPCADAAHAAGIGPRPLVFPADFGAHPDTRTEWWYVTGKLESGAETFGFQITFFRSRTGVAADHPSRFAASQLHFAHVALTDLGAGRMRHDQRIARAGFGRASAAEGDTKLKLGGWTLDRDGPANASRYRTRIATEHFEFDLVLIATQPVLLQGDAGFSRKGPWPEQASHYYSLPQLAVSGQLKRDGKSASVRGRAWFDHEWSNSLLGAEAVGWDWIGMNLDDGSALTAFRLRRADGNALYAGGSFRRADGRLIVFGPDEVRFTAERTWRSAASNAVYPVAWTLQTPAGRFGVTSLLDNQELDSRNSTGSIYWEGLSELRDAAGQRIGSGYLEMTGYAAALRL